MKTLLHDINDPKEKLFIKSVLDYSKKADAHNKAFFTDFHNGDWMRQTIEKHIGLHNLYAYSFFGGYEEAERQVLGFFPSYDEERLFPIGCLKIAVKTGLGKTLSHRDFLGALLGLGIERDTIGDIVVKSFGAYVIAKQNMLEYMTYSLTGIGKYQNIEVSEAAFSELELDEPHIKEISTTVASLRADAVLSAGFGLSRTSCTKLIQNDKATCNGMIASPSTLIKEGDRLTLRGYGKIRLKQVNGSTKKDRIHICIEKYL